eukprot:gnl/MRDRNA2_/MRDRNA2_127261_c0_seq1.p1 gnl/MRDRNA2_/MRDRNA2_127261_c0~~gnl/MRDRNA2_/MRDRNA2_127261_c0_seq1.p1  ORF type:complete len:643 (-),score=118.50 gnl/MRDRNA2_/MRDRNA2_127261_c0_seq1:7-1935(-)
MQDYTINDTDTSGRSVRITIKLPADATVRVLEDTLYATRPYAWDALAFFDGEKQLQMEDIVPHYVEMARSPLPEFIAMVGSEYQSHSMGIYERQKELVDGRPFWKLKQDDHCNDDVQERYLYWHLESKGWLVFQILGVPRCTMYLRDDIRNPMLSQVSWTTWTGMEWLEDLDVCMFVEPIVSPQLPDTLLITHSSMSAGVYERFGTRNARPLFKKRDDSRALYWSHGLQGWCIAATCDLLQEKEMSLYCLGDDVPYPSQSREIWEATAQDAGDGDLIKLWSPMQQSVVSSQSTPATVSQEIPELPGTLIMQNTTSASAFVADLQRAARSSSAVYIPANQLDKLLSELAASGLSIDVDKDLEDMVDQIFSQSELKEQIRRLYAKVKLQAQNVGEERMRLPHLALLGSSGTGKSTVAKLLGSAFFSMGFLKTDSFNYLLGSELAVLEDTEDPNEVVPRGSVWRQRTKAALAMGKGGILVVDDLHELALSHKGSGEVDPVKEVLEELIKTIDNTFSDTLIMITGHSAEMERLIESTTGLGQKVEQLQFADYSVNELTKMLFQKIEANEMQGAIDVTNNAVAALFNKVPAETRSRYNGALVNMIFDKAKEELREDLHIKYGDKKVPDAKKRTLKLEHLDCADKLKL